MYSHHVSPFLIVKPPFSSPKQVDAWDAAAQTQKLGVAGDGDVS